MNSKIKMFQQKWIIILCFCLLTANTQAQGNKELQFTYSLPIIFDQKWIYTKENPYFTQNYSGNDWYGNDFSHLDGELSIFWIFPSADVNRFHFYIGLAYSARHIDDYWHLVDEKYYSSFIHNYSSSFIEAPFGVKLRVNDNYYLDAFSFITLELSSGIFSHEKYELHESFSGSYTPPYTQGHSSITNYNRSYWGLTRLIPTIKFERETYIGENTTFTRGVSVSSPSWIINPKSSLEITNWRLNLILGLGYRFDKKQTK